MYEMYPNPANTSFVQQRLTILLELELNLFPNNYLYLKVYVFPCEDTAGAMWGETLPNAFQQRLTTGMQRQCLHSY